MQDTRINFGPIPIDDLLKRLDIIIETMEKGIVEPQAQRVVVNGLRGALIRMAQAQNNEAVNTRIETIVTLSLKVFGL